MGSSAAGILSLPHGTGLDEAILSGEIFFQL
jgi:hypothetical protein